LYLNHARTPLPQAQGLPRLSAGRGPVAVIDDDLPFIRMVERGLATEGITVQPVTTLDIAEAVHVVESGRCQAAFVDVFMYGDALGFSLVERLRQNAATRSLPIVVTSGARKAIGQNVEFLQRYRCGVLLKPFAVDDLLARVQPARS
jgi:DNA-binding response OmpR family regulator